MFYLSYSNWFLIWISFFMVPQIVHNILRGNRFKFDKNLIFGIYLSKIILPVNLFVN